MKFYIITKSVSDYPVIMDMIAPTAFLLAYHWKILSVYQFLKYHFEKLIWYLNHYGGRVFLRLQVCQMY